MTALPIHPTPAAATQPAPVPNDGPHIADLVCAEITTATELGADRHAITAEIRQHVRTHHPLDGPPLAGLLDALAAALIHARQHIADIEDQTGAVSDVRAMQSLYADLRLIAVAAQGHKVRHAARTQARAAAERAVQAAELAALVEAGYAADRAVAREAGDA